MSVKQLKKAMLLHKFIIVRHSNGDSEGINCGILKVKGGHMNAPDERITRIVSYKPCNFHEYISTKTAFL